MRPEEARAAARRAFGGVEQAKELQREARSFIWLEDLRRDIGYGVRTLTRTPGFTAVAIVTLALGIGAATVIYSVVRNVVLDPFPYAHSDRMVDIVLKDASDRIIRGPYFPAPEFLDYQEQSHAFADVVGTAVDVMHWIHDGGADRVVIAWMTPNGFTFLGVPPLLGRAFGAADVEPNAPLVAVLNHRAWIALFGGDPSVVGRTIVLNGESRTIVGIMPPRFEWNVADLWLPSALSRSDDPSLSSNLAGLSGTAQTRDHDQTGGSRAQRDCRASGRGSPARLSAAFAHRGHHRHRLGRPRVPGRPLHALRCRQPAAPDCLLQRGQHAAGPSDDARA